MRIKSVQMFCFLISFLFLSACMKKPISLIYIDVPEQVKQGESALLKWSFKNADKVIIKGIAKDFKAVDSIIVAPIKTTDYSITAIQGNVDTFNNTYKIKVLPIVGSKGITRGDFKLSNYKLEPSIFNSFYLNGAVDFQKVQSIAGLRILNMKYNKNSRNAKIKAILLDNFGNLIKNIDNKECKWGVRTTYGAISHYFDLMEKRDESKTIGSPILFTILIDQSSSTNNAHIIENVKNFVLKINPEDSIMIATFNQDLKIILPATDAYSTLSMLDKINFPEPSGISALYTNAMGILKHMEKYENKRKYLIIYTSNNNEGFSSIKSEDISNYANKLDIPIYIIGSGYSFDPYPLRYLSHSTGGIYYSIDIKTEEYTIDRILLEIAYSNVLLQYFEFTVPIPVETCKSLVAQLNFNYKNTSLSDNFNIILKYDEPYQKSRIIALFEHHSDVLNLDYMPIITELANYLIANSDKKIELIGTRSMEEEVLAEKDISQSRAEQIKQKLIELGVRSEQIKTSGKGASIPFYYFEKDEWQKAYNRRVEMRWLSPEYLPYEIIAETCLSEEEAQKKVDIWEQRGYRAYYERYIQQQNPIYKVKIWGFAEETEANKTASQINNKWGTNFKVE